jgi:hypothetical protein
VLNLYRDPTNFGQITVQRAQNNSIGSTSQKSKAIEMELQQQLFHYLVVVITGIGA